MSNFLFSVCLMFGFAISAVATEANTQGLMSSYMSVLQQTAVMLDAEHEREVYRLNRLNELADRGHASWLETRKQKLKADQLAAKSAIYKEFVAAVESSAASIHPTQAIPMGTGTVEFTDTVVNFDGHYDVFLEELKDVADSLRNELQGKKAVFQKLDHQTRSLSDSDSWKPSFELKLKVANLDISVCDARLKLAEQLAELIETRQRNFAHKQNKSAVGPQTRIDEQTRLDILLQLQANERIIQHSLAGERRRYGNLVALQEKGMDTTHELNAVGNNLEQLQSKMQNQRRVMNIVNSDLLVGNDAVDYDSPSEDGISNLFQLRRQFVLAEAKYHYQSAVLEKEMLSELLARLEKAAEKTNAVKSDHSRVARTLLAASRKELDGLRDRIASQELRMERALSRTAVLISGRSANELLIEDSRKNASAGLRSVPSLLSAAIGGTLVARFLVEPGNGSEYPTAAGESAKLSSVLLPDPLTYFPTTFALAGSDYLPAKLTDYRQSVRRRYKRRRSLTSAASPLRFDASMSSLTLRSRPTYTPIHAPERRPVRKFDRAYYNGIIRSELRPFLNPSQPPWYLPGSPTSLRIQQLRTDYQRDTFGRTGNELLRSRIYTDLYGR